MSSTAVEIGRLIELLTCPICLERYQSPRTLPCLHSFCTECLDRCRRSNRHQLECPVCKRPVSLSTLGIRALQIDHRIQQIEDIVDERQRMLQQQQSAVTQHETTATLAKFKCDMCIAQKRIPLAEASRRCTQCCMQFCSECSTRHDANPIFSTHRLQDLTDATDFCQTHVGCTIKFSCKQCQTLLCTICVIEHDPSHGPEPWDRAMQEKCRAELTEVFHQISVKVRELRSRAKRLETLRQTHQGSLYLVQTMIKSKANEMIQKVRSREGQLLEESQLRFDGFMKELGMDTMADLNFKQGQIESLHSELENLLNDPSPFRCVLAFEAVTTRYKGFVSGEPGLRAAGELSLQGTSSGGKSRASKKTIRFVSNPIDDTAFLIGSLQEFNVVSVDDDTSIASAVERILPRPSSTSGRVAGVSRIPQAAEAEGVNYRPHKKRTKSILTAICSAGGAGARREQAKVFGKLKSSTGTSAGSENPVAGCNKDGGGESVLLVRSGGTAAYTANSPSYVPSFASLNVPPTSQNPVTPAHIPDGVNPTASPSAPTSSHNLTTHTSEFENSISSLSHSPCTVSSPALSSLYNPFSPSYSPFYSLASSTYSPTSPTYVPASPSYYSPTSPSYFPASPSYVSAPPNWNPLADVPFVVEDGMPSPARETALDPEQRGPWRVRFLFQIERIGNLLGRLSSTTSATFVRGEDAGILTGPFSRIRFESLASSSPSSSICSTSTSRDSSWFLVVAESEQRIQVFDSKGSSMRLIGWGNTKPQVVATSAASEGALVYCTDRKCKTVKTFRPSDSWSCTTWLNNTFGQPFGLAVTCEGHLVVTDIAKKSVTVHCSQTGRTLRRVAHQAVPFEKPTYVAVDKEDNLFITDEMKKCIFVFNNRGLFLRVIGLHQPGSLYHQSTSSGTSQTPTPHGLAIDPDGDLLVCDPNNNRIVSCKPDGSRMIDLDFLGALERPLNVCFERSGELMAVVESVCSGEEGYGRVKVFTVLK